MITYDIDHSYLHNISIITYRTYADGIPKHAIFGRRRQAKDWWLAFAPSVCPSFCSLLCSTSSRASPP